MNLKDREKIIKRYNDRFEKLGPTIEALASGVEERRRLRFQRLVDIGIQQGDTILDLGCGFGDLYPFLIEKFGKRGFEYVGVDINPRLIDAAEKKYPDAVFIVKDITSEQWERSFDYIVSTTCFNLKLEHEDNYVFAEKILRTSYAMSKKGVAIDFLTSYVDFQSTSDAFYYEPEKIFSICKKITRRVALRHDSPLFDFCIYLYPDFQSWQTLL